MIRISELVLNFLLNAAWQITFIALVAFIFARLLSKAPARYLHALWALSLVLCVALPLWSLVAHRSTPSRIIKEQVARSVRTPAPLLPASNTQPLREASIAAPASTPISSFTLFWARVQSTFTDPRLFMGLALVYACFLVYRMSRLWISWGRTQSLRRSVYRREIPAMMTVIAAHCQAALKLKGVPLVCSAMAQAPVTVGARKPLIILPENCYRELERELCDDTLYSVLGHEMAHIARRDFALNIVYELLLLPIAFHPLTKYIKRQIDRTREVACDEIVTDKLLAREVHARSLDRVAGSLVVPYGQALMLGIFDADILEERIMKLTSNKKRLGRGAARLLAITAISLLCLSGLTIAGFSVELRAAQRVAAGSLAAKTNAHETGGQPFLQSGAQPPAQEPVRAKPAPGENERALIAGNVQQRAQAACDAGKRGAVEAIPQLVSLLGDDTRIEALKCWEFAEAKWNPALDTFKHPSPGEQAAIALASMGSPAFEVLTNALGSGNATVRRNAAWAIGELTKMAPDERTDAVMPLIALLGDGDSWVRMAAARALGELRDERAGERLIGALLDSEAGVRQTSAWALGEMKDERAVQTLCLVLISDARSDVRLAAAEALGEIRSQKAVASLNQALNDAEPRVRAKVRWAIAEIEDSDG